MKFVKLFSACLLFCVFSNSARAQSEPFLGQIMWVSNNYCPKGWEPANGQLLPINQNQALFSVLGTTYGGDGRQTFALPNMKGRMSLHTGRSGNDYVLGQSGGQESVTLSVDTLPLHSHNFMVSGDNGTTKDPTGNFLAQGGPYRGVASNATSLKPGTIQSTGASQPIDKMPPYLTLMACIALQGVFPSQN